MCVVSVCGECVVGVCIMCTVVTSFSFDSSWLGREGGGR